MVSKKRSRFKYSIIAVLRSVIATITPNARSIIMSSWSRHMCEYRCDELSVTFCTLHAQNLTNRFYYARLEDDSLGFIEGQYSSNTPKRVFDLSFASSLLHEILLLLVNGKIVMSH